MKNAFVLLPLVFTDAAITPAHVLRVVVVLAAFCCAASAIYCANDVMDRDADRAHPRKQHRPVASGQISAPMALAFAVILGVAAMWLALWASTWAAVLLAAYLANNLAYNLVLRHKTIADVMSIAVGFLLRILAGAAAIPVRPTSWLLLCGFFLALLLGFTKRRVEIAHAADQRYRGVLSNYSAQKLDVAISVTAAVTLVTYALYTVDASTVALHRTEYLPATLPLVSYGIFRIIFKAQEGSGDGPVDFVFRDPVVLMIGAAWVVMSFLILSYSQ
ncbi:Decaprenyl-phosphate phosphoribosyltransferase [Luteitalea pratensis]|uniref:Decaprenyl-phosphate phosphoribosyltransferase n=1 Tax=Luteitalea pratensis TaxID=1855912 RepID=A0A143PPK6_LUTPR|nr:Decaprenyl-phosphate phosphoribosyltransferase [Luteitalea pratensis]